MEIFNKGHREIVKFKKKLTKLRKKNPNDLIWINFTGVGKEDVLKGMGFEILEDGKLLLDGKEVHSITGMKNIHIEEVEGIVPSNDEQKFGVIVDVNEMEILEKGYWK